VARNKHTMKTEAQRRLITKYKRTETTAPIALSLVQDLPAPHNIEPYLIRVICLDLANYDKALLNKPHTQHRINRAIERINAS